MQCLHLGWPRVNYVKLELVQTLVKFTRLASGKSLYMVIIGHNSLKIWQNVKSIIWSRYNHCSKSLIYHLSWKSYPVFIDPNSHDKLTKNRNYIKLKSVLTFAQNHSVRSPVWSLLAPIHKKSWPELGQVGVSSTIA